MTIRDVLVASARTALYLSKGTATLCFGPVYSAGHCMCILCLATALKNL